MPVCPLLPFDACTHCNSSAIIRSSNQDLRSSRFRIDVLSPTLHTPSTFTPVLHHLASLLSSKSISLCSQLSGYRLGFQVEITPTKHINLRFVSSSFPSRLLAHSSNFRSSSALQHAGRYDTTSPGPVHFGFIRQPCKTSLSYIYGVLVHY